MRHRKHNNIEFYEKVGDGFNKLLSKFAKKTGIKKLCDKIVVRANENKKATFGIIITIMFPRIESMS